jgi:hypothetical protein
MRISLDWIPAFAGMNGVYIRAGSGRIIASMLTVPTARETQTHILRFSPR